MKRIRLFLLPLIIIGLCITLLNCGGGDDDDGGGIGGIDNQNAIESSNATSMDVIDRVLQLLFGDEAVPQSQNRASDTAVQRLMDAIGRQTEEVSLTLSCDPGNVSFDGLVTVEDLGNSATFEITGAMVFSNCAGINGTLALDTSGTATNREISLVIELNGPVSADGCSITFNQFAIDTTTNATGTAFTSDILANGGLNATCDGDSVACTFDDVDIEDSEQFENSCE